MAEYVEKLRGVNVDRLSGGATTAQVLAAPLELAALPGNVAVPISPGHARMDQTAVNAAKVRFAARKAARAK